MLKGVSNAASSLASNIRKQVKGEKKKPSLPANIKKEADKTNEVTTIKFFDIGNG